MTVDLKQWQALKAKADQHNKQAERSAGALEQLKSQLKQDYACPSIAKAEQLADSLQDEIATMEQEYAEAVEEFQEKHASKLEDSR